MNGPMAVFLISSFPNVDLTIVQDNAISMPLSQTKSNAKALSALEKKKSSAHFTLTNVLLASKASFGNPCPRRRRRRSIPCANNEDTSDDRSTKMMVTCRWDSNMRRSSVLLDDDDDDDSDAMEELEEKKEDSQQITDSTNIPRRPRRRASFSGLRLPERKPSFEEYPPTNFKRAASH